MYSVSEFATDQTMSDPPLPSLSAPDNHLSMEGSSMTGWENSSLELNNSNSSDYDFDFDQPLYSPPVRVTIFKKRFG